MATNLSLICMGFYRPSTYKEALSLIALYIPLFVDESEGVFENDEKRKLYIRFPNTF